MTTPDRTYAERAHGLEHKLRDIRRDLADAKEAVSLLISLAGQRGEPEIAATLMVIWSRVTKAHKALNEAPPVPEMPEE